MQLQDIEKMRRQEGIEDPELGDQIAQLKRGDFVKLTVLSGPESEWGETLRVRITSIRGDVFRGKLASRPSAAAFANLELGSSIVFRRGHIHSLSRGPALRK